METKTLKQPYKRRATTIYPKCLITFFTFFLLIYLEYSRNGSYLDEGLGIVCLVILLLNVYKISQQDLITIAILIFVELIGLISNLIYEVNDSIFSVLVDALTQSKFILVFYAIKYFLTEKEKRKLINMILPFSRIYIVVAFIFAFISLFVNIGMGEAERYGLHPFRFIFHFSFQFVLVSYLFFGAIIHTDKLSDKQKRFYYVLGVLSILASLKSPGLMFSMLFTFLSFYFQRNNKLSLRIILPIIFVGIWLGEFQIENYLLEETSPRRMFFDYSFKTANTYFPLGSGFGTFGYAEAA